MALWNVEGRIYHSFTIVLVYTFIPSIMWMILFGCQIAVTLAKKLLLNCFLGTQKCLLQKSLAEWDFSQEHPSLHPGAEQETSP